MKMKGREKFIKRHLHIIIIMEIVTDQQIQKFISEIKLIDKDWKPSFRDRKSYFESKNEFIGEEGNIYKIIIKYSKINPLDFSVIFGIMLEGKLFRVKRYNGDAGDHTNSIERDRIEGFHIHKATQIYQENGFREDAFAIKTTKFSDWKSALKLMLAENNFLLKVDDGQSRLI